MADSDRRTVGQDAERRALAYLRNRGLTRVASNFRTRFGEIDLVMHDGDCLVFVEVRYRRAGAYASAAQSVDTRKQRKLARAAAGFIRMNPGCGDSPMRFDVVAVDRNTDGSESVEWLADAFRIDF